QPVLFEPGQVFLARAGRPYELGPGQADTALGGSEVFCAFVVSNARGRRARLGTLRRPSGLFEQRVHRGGIDGPVAAGAVGRRGHGKTAVAVDLVEPLLYHLQGQEVLSLLAQDETQSLDVRRVELPIAGGWPPGI